MSCSTVEKKKKKRLRFAVLKEEEIKEGEESVMRMTHHHAD